MCLVTSGWRGGQGECSRPPSGIWESGSEKAPRPIAPVASCHPLPQTLVSSSPLSLHEHLNWTEQFLSCLAGMPQETLSQVQTKDGIAGRALDHRGWGLHPGFLPPFRGVKVTSGTCSSVPQPSLYCLPNSLQDHSKQMSARKNLASYLLCSERPLASPCFVFLSFFLRDVDLLPSLLQTGFACRKSFHFPCGRLLVSAGQAFCPLQPLSLCPCLPSAAHVWMPQKWTRE